MRVFLICLALFAAGPASALSCLRPDAVRLFEYARDAEADFYIVKGRITLLEAANLPEKGSKTPAMTRARVDGTALTTRDFEAPFSRDVTIETSCASIWCGTLDGLDGPLLMALETDGKALTLRVGPCGGDVVRWDEPGERRLLKCHRDGVCSPAEY